MSGEKDTSREISSQNPTSAVAAAVIMRLPQSATAATPSGAIRRNACFWRSPL
jgi:hypothetical protein